MLCGRFEAFRRLLSPLTHGRRACFLPRKIPKGISVPIPGVPRWETTPSLRGGARRPPPPGGGEPGGEREREPPRPVAEDRIGRAHAARRDLRDERVV